MKTLEELQREMDIAWAAARDAWAAARAAARDADWAAARAAEYVYRKRLKEIENEDS